MAASAISALPAQATETGDGVTDGHNITVFHNINMVTTAGWTPGETLTVNVLRNGVPIGTASGPAVDPLGEGAGLEVNHGVEGTPQPGDCFEGTTPDIRPGDVVQVSNGTVTDEVTVDDIRFDGPPAADGADVVVPVFAMRYDGTPFTPAELDAPEFRDGSRLRANAGDDPGALLVEAVDAAAGQFQLRYVAPFDFSRNRDNLSEEQIRNRLLTVLGGHMIGFGHTEPPPGDAQLVEGIGDATAPAAGCEGSPMAQRAVSQVTPAALNLGNEGSDLTVQGLSQDASQVVVTLNDGTTEVVSEPVTPTPATGAQTWTASFTAEQLAPLDGNIVVSGQYTDAATSGILSGPTKTVVKDLVAPAAPSVSVPGGSYLGRQDITINSGPESAVRYTLGNGNQPDPTATSGSRYTGGQIAITSSQTLKMVAVDSAGNTSPVVSETYSIDSRITPARPAAPKVTAGRARATVRWAPPAANGGPAVTRYRIRVYRRTTLVDTVHAGPNATRRTIRGLRNGVWHRFRVQARNSVGYGVLSPRTRAVIPRGAPGRPRVRRAFSGAPGGRATARVAWRRPANNGGRRITAYRLYAFRMQDGSVQQRRRSRVIRPSARSASVRLPRGQYRFKVRAFNRLGRSNLSPRTNQVRAR
ncbi:MAG TPA: fibronectin type III domain-containing protein [Nocardioidaceae bacterium]|nr:fibronectin type III domain-containing protein [Nocardioidaceae bacterium]